MNNQRLILNEGYYFRFEQASNLILFLYESNISGTKLTRSSISQELGFPERMIKNVTNYCKATGLLTEGRFKLSNFGYLVAKYDPYFSDIGTLWLMHFLASSNKNWIIWNRIFNNILYEITQGTPVSGYAKQFDFLSGRFSENTINKNISSEVNGILISYSQQQLSKLGLITQIDDEYFWNKNQPMDPVIFWALVMAFKEHYYEGATTLDVSFIASEQNSPGRICLMTLPSVREKLENLHKQKFIQLETRADLDQVRFISPYAFIDIVELYYRGIYE